MYSFWEICTKLRGSAIYKVSSPINVMYVSNTHDSVVLKISCKINLSIPIHGNTIAIKCTAVTVTDVDVNLL